MRTFALALCLTACGGTPFGALASAGLEDARVEADSGASDSGTGGAPGAGGAGHPEGGAATGGSGTGGASTGGSASGGAPEAGGTGSGGAPDAGAGGLPGSGGTPGAGGTGTGGSGTGGTLGAGGAPCDPNACSATLEDGTTCKSPCCTDQGHCGCSASTCAPIDTCTPLRQPTCGGASSATPFSFACFGVAPPSGCMPGTANTGYVYFCCPKASYP